MSTMNPMWSLTWNFLTWLHQWYHKTTPSTPFPLIEWNCSSHTALALHLHWFPMIPTWAYCWHTGSTTFRDAMPLSFRGHCHIRCLDIRNPQVESFFRNQHQQCLTYQKFGDIQEARQWAWSLRGKSSTAHVAGAGKWGHVIIQKTKEYHNSLKAAYAKHYALYMQMNRQLQKPLPDTMSRCTIQVLSVPTLAPPAPKRAEHEVMVID